jgi:hypothetical protein
MTPQYANSPTGRAAEPGIFNERERPGKGQAVGGGEKAGDIVRRARLPPVPPPRGLIGSGVVQRIRAEALAGTWYQGTKRAGDCAPDHVPRLSSKNWAAALADRFGRSYAVHSGKRLNVEGARYGPGVK